MKNLFYLIDAAIAASAATSGPPTELNLIFFISRV